MIFGRLICEKCEKDCTELWGIGLGISGSARNTKQAALLVDFEKEFGKKYMVWCANCAAKIMGVIPVKADETPPEAEEPIPTTAYTILPKRGPGRPRKNLEITNKAPSGPVPPGRTDPRPPREAVTITEYEEQGA